MTINKNDLVREMTRHLEDMCAYLATGETQLFHYCAGRADGLRRILEEYFYWDERSATEHIKNMWDIMDENW